jgi:hypothetical protein
LSGPLTLKAIKQNWQEVIKRLQKTNKSAAPFLLDAEPVALKDGIVSIGFYYPLHIERFNTDKNIHQLQRVMRELFETDLKIKCELAPKRLKMQAAEEDPVIRTAVNLGARIVKLTDKEEQPE